MSFKRCLDSIFIIAMMLTILFFGGITYIFHKSYEDPRWRIFDYNSKQATEGEIYNVAEIPAISSVRIVGERRLRFKFTPPISATSWTVIALSDSHIVSKGSYPEIIFSEKRYSDTYQFIPQGISLNKDITITIGFFPAEEYHKIGLSWPDNYYAELSSVPFSLTQAWSIDEWAGLPDTDPDIIEAQQLIGDKVDRIAPSIVRSEQVFRFIMEKIKDSGGIPTDKLQVASPLETYKALNSGTGKGWCENRALVYYILANAVGVKTRLVDIAGKFGPLKLTGHYFCESWNPDENCWYMVDPQMSVAYIRSARGKLLNALDIKRLCDIDQLDGCTTLTFNRTENTLIIKSIDEYYQTTKNYFNGDIVLAYKFGYPKNKSYSKLIHFIKYPTLLYAPFKLPNLYLIKQICLMGFVISFIISVVLGIKGVISRKSKRSR